MIVRIGAAGAIVALAVFALWHPARHQAIVALSPAPDFTEASSGERPRRARFGDERETASAELVVYVAGAVKRPGLYRLKQGDRYDSAVALAGGFRPDADAEGINLAQRAVDGDEVLVPRIGEETYRANSGRSRGSHRSTRRHRRVHSAPAQGSVDVNVAQAADLARVPGIGRAIAGRIVELRDREGTFASLDELLDVAGMTQSRLERARPYLREVGGAEVSPH